MIGDLVVPAVPVIGIDPTVQWVLAVAAAMLPALFSVLLIFLKQKFNADRATSNGNKIAAAAGRGAVLGYDTGITPQNVVAIGVNYVKKGVPDAVAATPQATDDHLADMIKANLPRAVASVRPGLSPDPRKGTPR